ncbi:MAG: C25 family cysteine peptidase [Candidatus Cloacimonadales bacterium]
MKKSLILLITLLISITWLTGNQIIIDDGSNNIKLISSDDNATILELNISSFYQNPVTIDGEIFSKISIPQEAESCEKGAPELPTLTRSIIIDKSNQPILKIIDSEYKEFNMRVAPSKGVITRDIDPATVPYEFSHVYTTQEFYPQTITSLNSPYILRNHRGVAVTFTPFQYNPSSQTLRVYTQIIVEISNSNQEGINQLTHTANYNQSFTELYKNHFLNYDESRYAPLDEFGSILVIAPQNYISTMQIYANWKIQKGIPTEIVNVATIGNNSTSIKNYIQNYYNSHPELAFVQIAGDAAQVASLNSGGGGADPMYALVAGSDNYPDIFIGRFSAENTDQLLTQVERTLEYERDLNTSATHLNKAMGIASSEGGSQGDNGETDIQHMNIIRNNLLNYNYTSVDQIHDPSASASAVGNALNSGRGQINYIGHGSNTSWGTTGFSNSHVNNLTNVGKLPFIVSVACVNGNFVSTTCFAEAWLRATHNGSPTGALAIYASSINQSWASPMRGQDEINILLTQETLSTIGGLFYSGSCKMMDHYGTDGVNMFKTWIVFGDASLQVRSNIPQTMNVNHPGTLIAGSTAYSLNTGVADALVAITYNNQILGSSYSDSNGNATITLNPIPTTPRELTLTITALNKVTLTTPISVINVIQPANLNITIANDVAVELQWDAVPNATYYKIFYSPDFVNWVQVGLVRGTYFQHNRTLGRVGFYNVKAGIN